MQKSLRERARQSTTHPFVEFSTEYNPKVELSTEYNSKVERPGFSPAQTKWQAPWGAEHEDAYSV